MHKCCKPADAYVTCGHNIDAHVPTWVVVFMPANSNNVLNNGNGY